MIISQKRNSIFGKIETFRKVSQAIITVKLMVYKYNKKFHEYINCSVQMVLEEIRKCTDTLIVLCK